MANTYSCLFFHVVFSTKNREPWIAAELEERIWAYLGGISKENDVAPVRVGGVGDHVHMVLRVPPSLALSTVVKAVKGGSSKWIHDTFPKLAGFGWQDGYGAFSVSKSRLQDAVDYVANQREHHRTRTFQEEYRALLEKHGIEFDEKFLWG